MLKIIVLFKVKFKYDNDEVTYVCIQCNSFNKTVTFQFSETVRICTLTVFNKAAVFLHVGLLWMLETKEQYKSLLMNMLLNDLQ